MSRRYRLSKQDMKSISKKLYLYREVDKAIAIRKQELMIREQHDENIGGGRSSKISNPTHDIVEKWMMDDQIIYIENFRKRVDELINKLDDASKLLFHYQWIDTNYYTEDELAKLCLMSDRTVRRKKRAILEMYDDACGGFW
ncbi:transcriptional regulator [Lactococcus taiwanensis]|uniref:Transcriptional regulator n=1 Tax=Lactococcus taiwanensis TaxID=1151742 RepID=A0AA45KFH3_9LACT|nr:transcriptional regulator [Lactococcus taiwanensis]QSE76327.1 transcriptional regulator [Lactococcus taiwanensis]